MLVMSPALMFWPKKYSPVISPPAWITVCLGVMISISWISPPAVIVTAVSS
jgi:hypothetical protein